MFHVKQSFAEQLYKVSGPKRVWSGSSSSFI